WMHHLCELVQGFAEPSSIVVPIQGVVNVPEQRSGGISLFLSNRPGGIQPGQLIYRYNSRTVIETRVVVVYFGGGRVYVRIGVVGCMRPGLQVFYIIYQVL